MCYNCGCENLHDDMGDKENITEETFEKASKAWGQSVDEAKENTLNALKHQLEKNERKDNPGKKG